MKHDKMILTAIAALLVSAFSCTKPDDGPDVDSPVTDAGLIITKDGKSSFQIVCSGGKSTVSGLWNYLASVTGVGLPIKAVSDEAGDYEIVVGVAAYRPEMSQAIADLQGRSGYSVRVVGSRIFIAGSDSNWLQLGMRAFTRKINSEGWIDSEGTICIPGDASIIETTDNPMMIARLVSLGQNFTLTGKQVLKHAPVGDIRVAQGAASDGEYFYFVMRTSDDTKAVVYKYDMKSLQLVAQSAEFNGGHCNDLAYDALNKRLIVVHGQSQGKILTPVDAASLAVRPNINISVGSGALTYNASHSGYAISQGGSTFYVSDDNFKILVNKKRTDSTGYTAQGMGSDDSYVYFPMSGKSDNVLVVYDWNGNYITTLTVPFSMESETLFYVNGRYYINFYSSGAVLYEITPVYTFTYAR